MIRRKADRELTLLLVDDNIELMNLCAAALKMSGASVLTAGSPAEALSLLDKRAVNNVGVDVGIDVAIIDYRLPGMNGCVLADCLRALRPDLKIILYSAEFEVPEAEMSSVDAFVPKAGGVQPLLAQISELVDVGYDVGYYEFSESTTNS